MGSFNLSSLPCMENLFEDTSVDVSVEVGDAAEVAEETTEAAEVATDVQEDTAEASDTETTTELLFQHIDTLINRKMYLETYGYDRRFAMLAAQDGIDYIRGGAPAVESVNDVSSANDSYTIAALEGVGDALKSAWEWIKKVLGKIASWVGRFFRSVVMMFSSLENNIIRLKRLENESSWDSERAEKASGDVPESKSEMEKAMNEAFDKNKTNSHGFSGSTGWSGVIDALQMKYKRAIEWSTSDMIHTPARAEGSAIVNSAANAYDKLSEDKDKVKEDKEATKKITEDMKKVADKKTSISNATAKSVSEWLGLATAICKSKMSINNLGDTAAKAASTAKKQAEKYSALNSTDGRASTEISKSYRLITTYLSYLQSFSAKYCGALIKIANWLVKGSAKVLGACYKKNKS